MMLWPRMRSSFGGGDPWRELRQLQREVNRVFDSSGLEGRHEFPAVNLWTNSEGAVVTAEIPGVDPKDIDIAVEGDTLTIRGSRKPMALKEGEAFHRQERTTGDFIRSLQLPFSADAEKVNAEYKHGVLRVTLPIAEKEKPKKIAVKAS